MWNALAKDEISHRSPTLRIAKVEGGAIAEVVALSTETAKMGTMRKFPRYCPALTRFPSCRQSWMRAGHTAYGHPARRTNATSKRT